MNDDSPDVLEKSQPDDERDLARQAASDTVGTGSYLAVSCSVLALLATFVLIAGLLISRWLG